MDDSLLLDYAKFVKSVTSKDSLSASDFVERVDYLHRTNFFNVPLMLTASVGMASEAGEFSDNIKKLFFHGKEPTPELRQELVKELGDVLWYWANACNALDIDPVEVINKNIEKLSKRYPGGFDAFRSANKEKLGV